jgi:hypothetical protein
VLVTNPLLQVVNLLLESVGAGWHGSVNRGSTAAGGNTP